MVARAVAAAALACFVTLAHPREARAQQSVADSLWRMGQRGQAIEQYRRILSDDSNAVRANFRMAEALVGTSIDSALHYIRNARVRVPDDPDLMFTEAKYLSWARKFSQATIQFDSLLAAHPELDYARVARARTLSWSGNLEAARQGYQDVLARKDVDPDSRRDAAFGLAQVATWQGNLASAADQYASLLADDPNEVRVLVGFASVRNYQGRPFAAMALIDRALAADSTDADAKQIQKSIRQGQKPAAELNLSWSHDSDDNNVAWQTLSQTFIIGDGKRVGVRLGNQRAVDPARRTSRYLGEITGTISPRSAQFTVGVGARSLNVESAPVGAVGDRTELTWRAIASVRPTPPLLLGVAVERVPFDEIAALLARGINLTNVEGNVDYRVLPGTSVSASAGTLGFSDGNRRTGASLRVSQRAPHSLTIGFLARTFAFAKEGDGYFTPKRFILGDTYVNWEYGTERWSAGFSGGGGVQRLGPDSPTQGQWHVDGRTGVHFSNGMTIDVFGGASTSHAASAAEATVGSFHYATGGLSARIPF